jgi:methylmalonyl-CoA mutase N-terminal domain/subunit
MHVDTSLQARQMETLRALRIERDNSEVAAQLARLENAARSDTNLMPYIITGVEKLCTLGEVSDVLRRVFGTYDASH